MTSRILIIILIISIILNIVFVFRINELNKNVINVSSDEPSDYRLTKPLKSPVLDSNVNNPSAILHFNETKPKIISEISKHTGTENVGVFLQDINTGAWLGINEQVGFAPASMLKIPIMLGIMKKVDRKETEFTDEIEILEEDIDPYSGTLYQEGAGSKHTVWELIKEMILSSDNTSKNMLRRQLTEAELNAVYTHVGIPNPYLSQNDQTVTPRGYTRVLKSLYYSSFLSPELSEKALDIMTDTEMENLISAGIPPEIQVAHKYSERPTGLGDCGIIYHPHNPYTLCIMTKDMEVAVSKTIITSLSRIIYEDISNREF